jgi:hypothetical protein
LLDRLFPPERILPKPKIRRGNYASLAVSVNGTKRRIPPLGDLRLSKGCFTHGRSLTLTLFVKAIVIQVWEWRKLKR